LIHSVPGDPISFYISRGGLGRVSRPQLDAIRREHHLDKPLVTQYGYWLRGIVTLDLGHSITDRRPVAERIADGLPNTFQLNLAAFLLSALLGIPIGMWSATRSGRRTERASAVIFFLLYSLPSFWIALLLMQWLAVRWPVFPLFGMESDYSETFTMMQRLGDRVWHAVLPVICLSYAQLAFFARFSKSALTEVIRQDFITTARAKGAAEPVVLWRHAFRNALVPMITLLGLVIPTLLSGSVIIESIFQWNGIGLLYYDSIQQRDYPTVMGLTVTTAIATLLASLLADVLYAMTDPRVRLGKERR
ncbi:MAG TPA: ABC transporter permease, partial [Thermoanaerobaculia bacterium]|nr:ABC transporter permease [Thermoanaerobaculia bacterium]